MNIGIIAHVDAGKTTLTENILHLGGVVKEIGRVDKGNTQTDSMAVERRRGISVRAAVTSFIHNSVQFNLIDTPGHVDFVAEVERVFSVLDGVVLVVSAKEGLQSQTRVLMDTIVSLGMPCIVFINKIDRMGAELKKVFADVKDYMGGWLVNAEEMDDELAQLAKAGQVYPAFYGSALKGVGVKELLDAIPQFLPEAAQEADKAVSGVVFKIDNSTRERLAYVRLYQGRLQLRDMVDHNGKQEKIVRLARLEGSKVVQCNFVEAGDITVLYLKDLKVGNVIGEPNQHMRKIRLARPTLSVEVLPNEPAQKRMLYESLVQLADEDPLLDLSNNKKMSVHMFGEVQMEILHELLFERYGISVHFSQSSTIYMEVPTKMSSAVAPIFKSGMPYAAGVGFRIEPLSVGSGLQYVTEVSFGDLEKPFQNAVQEAVFETCKHGVYGWEITDVKIIFDYADYHSVKSTPSDFRNLTPLVLMEAFTNAGVTLLEPYLDFELQVPQTSIAKAIYDLQCMKGEIAETINGDFIRITGIIPSHNCKGYGAKIGGYTEGQGIWLTKFHGYRPTAFAEDKVNTDEVNIATNKTKYILYKSGGAK
ncbi:MAG: TetM/TetW/TetO/TetS family tetracycline resistance ribosomal protection protein [Defluviitaleaceae bacterium]|nr:TetM/TetW/TetO/TetS family tetracycline resistance ribosomal protection protein [Defluviitaleaceae bacterium]